MEKDKKVVTLIGSNGKRTKIDTGDFKQRPFHGKSPFTGDKAETIIALYDDNGNVCGIGTSGSMKASTALAISDTDLDAMMLHHAKDRGCKIFDKKGKRLKMKTRKAD